MMKTITQLKKVTDDSKRSNSHKNLSKIEDKYDCDSTVLQIYRNGRQVRVKSYKQKVNCK